MKPGDIVLIIAIILIVVGISTYLIIEKKKGKGGCACCKGSCPHCKKR